MKQLDKFDEKTLHKLLNARIGETKIGERIQLCDAYESVENAIKLSTAKYVLLGIPEDIGPRANYGKAGADKTYDAFLSAFLNMQHNVFLDGSKVLLLGAIKTADLQKKSKTTTDAESLRLLVNELDERVWPVVNKILVAGKIPIVVGGGHNNAYPILKGLANSKKNLNCAAINIDPHADLRAIEGRHSGNGFSYAIADGYLDKYYIIGLQEQYNSQYIYQKLAADKNLFDFVSYNDYLMKAYSAKKMVAKSLKFISDYKFGLELDIDSISMAESSAKTPSGFDVITIRKMVKLLAKEKNIAYFNISEGICSDSYPTGKLIAYLVADFIS